MLYASFTIPSLVRTSVSEPWAACTLNVKLMPVVPFFVLQGLLRQNF